ncbi:diheme cytochrome c [Mariprofundus sp. EBB-1]|uniref:diheme cytochrome c n=1 Tax=Mariprofundus sp. EBB-1 TaxID=2650971 RepID=UPI0019125AE9|nr:diheme cytochrome c [Mariprofundus sp. EBB-1]
MLKKIFALLLLVFLQSSWAFAHDIFGFPRHRGVEPLVDKKYESSCGECHFAYQPGLLPSRSWAKMMRPEQLEDHFGENAELAEKERLYILKFLTENGADKTWHYKRSVKINQSIPENVTPLRITETPYIKKKHMEIPRRMIQDNKKVRGLSYCNKCHTEAVSKGQFSRTNVDIPNFRNWDDLID